MEGCVVERYGGGDPRGASRYAVVVPSNRPERLAEFRQAWQSTFDRHDVTLYVVLDEEPWEGIPEFIPRRSDMIRSWGFYRAWRAGHEFTVSLDDDVLPADLDLFDSYEWAFGLAWASIPYLGVGHLSETGINGMRGYPYAGRWQTLVVQYGGWDGVPDLDGRTQLDRPTADWRFSRICVPVPRGVATTCCAMNMAFQTDFTPVMWQLPLLGRHYNRWGDIWSGLIQKRVLDRMRCVMLINGRAVVNHDRASDPQVNMEKENCGAPLNELLWDALPDPESTDALEAFREVTWAAARFFEDHDPQYASHFLRCRDEWLALFD